MVVGINEIPESKIEIAGARARIDLPRATQAELDEIDRKYPQFFEKMRY